MTVISFLNILLNLFDFFDHADHCSDGRGRATSESIALVSGSQKWKTNIDPLDYVNRIKTMSLNIRVFLPSVAKKDRAENGKKHSAQ